MKEIKLYGCVSKNEEEIDGCEFEITTLAQLVELLRNHKELHLNYFEGKEDLDIWLRTN